jgi:hypothetical protein
MIWVVAAVEASGLLQVTLLSGSKQCDIAIIG